MCEVVENFLVSVARQCTHMEIKADTMPGTCAPDTESLEAKLRIQRNFRGDLNFAKPNDLSHCILLVAFYPRGLM